MVIRHRLAYYHHSEAQLVNSVGNLVDRLGYETRPATFNWSTASLKAQPLRSIAMGRASW
jgi:hypothetical protein